MKILIWHWGRRGAGPRYAAALAQALGTLPGTTALLSLPDGAEILSDPSPPVLALPVQLYSGRAGFLWRLLTARLRAPLLARRIQALRPDIALCAMPAMLDLLMAMALRTLRIKIAVVVHDAAPHPGERVPLQHRLQKCLLKRASMLIALSAHVADSLRAQGWQQPIVLSRLPPLFYGTVPPPQPHGDALRVLSFGRLLPYKGLDLLAQAWAALPDKRHFTLRVVGQGPESPVLDQLRALPNVQVENRWVPDAELPDLLGWADALVLSHREASQSGIAAAAMAAGRPIVATRVGGLVEQLQHEPSAILCAPDGAALAAGIAALHSAPRQTTPPDDAWARTATALLQHLREVCPGNVSLTGGHTL